jgi:hypothetical protein
MGKKLKISDFYYYHLENFCLPYATLRSQLERWRAGREREMMLFIGT